MTAPPPTAKASSKSPTAKSGHVPAEALSVISARASRTIAELAISELIADKLPFTPSRLNAGLFASRIASGAICGAAVCGAVKRPLAEGALLGGLGAIAGALGGYHVLWQMANFQDESIFVLQPKQ